MADCPNKECHDNLSEVRAAVYGKSGLRSKVSKIAVWIALTAIGVPLFATGFATGIKVWFGNETAAMRFADLRAVSVLREKVIAQEIQYNFLCTSLNEIKATLTEMRRDLKAIEKP